MPPVAVALPWGSLDGEPRTVPLYLSTPEGRALFRTRFNLSVWKPAIRATGIEDHRRNGMRVLRHTYASVLLDAGEHQGSVALPRARRPGVHAAVYTDLLPSSEDRTRRAIDRAFGHATDTPDGLERA
jgi:hypothetical protein